jgi:hypothetical protein
MMSSHIGGGRTDAAAAVGVRSHLAVRLLAQLCRPPRAVLSEYFSPA